MSRVSQRTIPAGMISEQVRVIYARRYWAAGCLMVVVYLPGHHLSLWWKVPLWVGNAIAAIWHWRVARRARNRLDALLYSEAP